MSADDKKVDIECVWGEGKERHQIEMATNNESDMDSPGVKEVYGVMSDDSMILLLHSLVRDSVNKTLCVYTQ